MKHITIGSLAFAVFLFSSLTWAQIARVAVGSQSSGSVLVNSLSVPLTSEPFGQLILAVVTKTPGCRVVSVTDQGADVWTKLLSLDNGTSEHLELWQTVTTSVDLDIIPAFTLSTKAAAAAVSYTGVLSLGANATGIGFSSTPLLGIVTQSTSNWCVGAFGADGTSTFSQFSGNLLASKVTNGKDQLSNVGIALVDNLTTASENCVLGVTLSSASSNNKSGAEQWAGTMIELRAQ